jgi:hypothetical protein
VRSPRSARPPPKADPAAAAAYNTSVFINCPFDDGYRPLFRATVFAVYDCGFNPRCALEVYDSGQVRIEKIMRLAGGRPLPGGTRIAGRFAQFTEELPAIAAAFHLEERELTFKNYANFAAEWLSRRLLEVRDPLA